MRSLPFHLRRPGSVSSRASHVKRSAHSVTVRRLWSARFGRADRTTSSLGAIWNCLRDRTAGRVLDDREIEQVQHDVELEVEQEKADVAGDDDKATKLAVRSVLRYRVLKKSNDA